MTARHTSKMTMNFPWPWRSTLPTRTASLFFDFFWSVFQGLFSGSGFQSWAVSCHLKEKLVSVVWEHQSSSIFNFSINIGFLVIPTDELIFFRGVAKNHQPESRIWLWPLPIGQVGLLMPHFSMEKSEAITICGACSILNVFTMLFTMYLPCYICPQFWLKQVHGFFLTDRYWSNLLPRNAVQLCSSPTHDFQSATSSNQIG